MLKKNCPVNNHLVISCVVLSVMCHSDTLFICYENKTNVIII